MAARTFRDVLVQYLGIVREMFDRQIHTGVLAAVRRAHGGGGRLRQRSRVFEGLKGGVDNICSCGRRVSSSVLKAFVELSHMMTHIPD